MNIYSYKDNYPDRVQPDWVRVLPIAGRPIQSAELLEMQSIWMNHLRNSVGALYRSGTPLSGLRLINNNPSSTPNYYVTPGVILVDGIALNVTGKELGTLDPTKTHHIYIQVTETVITELDDPNLRDPAHGGALYGLEGAHRLRWAATVVLNPTPVNGYKLAEIQEGKIIQAPLVSGYQSLIDLMALYTYERSGNFLVRGLSVSHSHSVPGVDVSTPIGQELKEAINVLRTDLSNKKQELADLSIELQAIQGSNTSREFQVRQGIEQLASVIQILQEDLGTFTNQLSSYPVPKPAQEVFSVSPGVAYVMGYRIDRPHPELISISRDTYKREAISARYTYSPTQQSALRTITGTSKTLTCELTGLRGLPLVTVTVTFPSPVSADILLDALVSGYRSPNDKVTFLAEGHSSDSARSLLTSQVSLHRVSEYSIEFSLIYSRDLVNLLVTGEALNTSDGYLSSLSNPPIKKYELAMKPVASILRVVADLIAEAIPIVKQTGDDYLGDDTVLQVYRVEQGRTVYLEGQDYTLANNRLIWVGQEPQVGSTYYVSFSYTQPLTLDEDYRLNKDYLEFVGRTPMPGGFFTVDYEYYLSQSCLLYIDKEGIISYILSAPSPTPVIPVVTPDLLPLALIELAGVKPLVKEYTYKRVTPQLLNELLELSEGLLPETGAIDLKHIDVTKSTYTLKGGPPVSITVPCHIKNVSLRYLGGGSLYMRDRYPLSVSLPLSSSEPTGSLLPDGADQPRATSYVSLKELGSPYITVTPSLDMSLGYTNPLPNIPAPLNQQDDRYSQAFLDGNALFDDMGQGKAPIVIRGYNLNPTLSYSLWVNNQPVGFRTSIGFVTSLGVRPISRSLQLELTPDTTPGTHLIELRPTEGPPVSCSYSVYGVLKNHIKGVPSYSSSPLKRGPVAQPHSIRQSFSLRRPRYVTGVQLRFRKALNLEACVLLVDEQSSTLLARGVTEQVFVSTDSSAVTNYDFREPLLLVPDRLYSICLVITSGEVQVFTATLGEEDLITEQPHYLGAQVYNGGHLYLPGGAEAYEQDLTYTLNLCEFLVEPQVIELGEYGLPDLVTGVTAIAVNTRDICPLGTNIAYQYSFPMSSGWKEITPNKYTPLPSAVDKVTLRAMLYTSNKYLSPSLTLEGSSISLYSYQQGGQITSLPIPVPIQKTLKVYIEWEGVGKVLVKYTHSNGQTSLLNKVSSINGALIKEVYSIALPPGEIRYTVELVNDRNLSNPPTIRNLAHELL